MDIGAGGCATIQLTLKMAQTQTREAATRLVPRKRVSTRVASRVTHLAGAVNQFCNSTLCAL